MIELAPADIEEESEEQHEEDGEDLACQQCEKRSNEEAAG